jgi:DNA-binding transcriptional regulator YhcF (GntR family)
LNFNTIKKVFALLEADGVIESRQGAGFFVTAGAVENKNVLAKAEEELRLTIARVRDAGLSEEAATRILSEIYTKEEE